MLIKMNGPFLSSSLYFNFITKPEHHSMSAWTLRTVGHPYEKGRDGSIPQEYILSIIRTNRNHLVWFNVSSVGRISVSSNIRSRGWTSTIRSYYMGQSNDIRWIFLRGKKYNKSLVKRSKAVLGCTSIWHRQYVHITQSVQICVGSRSAPVLLHTAQQLDIFYEKRYD